MVSCPLSYSNPVYASHLYWWRCLGPLSYSNPVYASHLYWWRCLARIALRGGILTWVKRDQIKMASCLIGALHVRPVQCTVFMNFSRTVWRWALIVFSLHHLTWSLVSFLFFCCCLSVQTIPTINSLSLFHSVKIDVDFYKKKCPFEEGEHSFALKRHRKNMTRPRKTP